MGKGRRRLFWQVYLHGIFMLVAVATMVGVLAWTGGAQPFWDELGKGIQRALEAPDTAEALQRRVEALSDLTGISAALYGPDNTLLAKGGPHPPPPLDLEDVAALEPRDHDHYRADGKIYSATRIEATAVIPAGAYASIYWREQKSPLKFLAVLLGMLAALALASVPLARHIARPLERLTATAQALGAGDLSARTGLKRRDEVGALARAMDEMAERLDAMLASEREMLANISHELRTPMARIRVALELAADDGEGPGFLADIEQDLGELEALVADVLASARLGQEGLPLHLTTIDVRAIAEAARDRLHARHPRAALQVTLPDDLDAAPALQADSALIRRVLDNLVENAVKHGAPPVALAVQADAQGITFTVSDHGPGLCEADRRRVFEPFFRADRSRARGTGGVGLGLSLCKRIVDAHGGHISVEVREGGGAMFMVRLVAAPTAARRL